MKPNPKIKVTQGCAFVNTIWQVRKGPGVIVFEADLRAKRAEIQAMSQTQLYIGAGDQTLHADEGKGPTVIEIDAFPDQTIEATIGRYTLAIFVYSRAKNSTLVWESEEPREEVKFVEEAGQDP